MNPTIDLRDRTAVVTGIQVNAITPGYVATLFTAPLVADEEFSAWISRRSSKVLLRF